MDTKTLVPQASMAFQKAEQKSLREFLSHLYLNCMIQNQNTTDDAENRTENYEESVTLIPRYLEDVVLNEGSIDLQQIDQASAERDELYATISIATIAPINAEIRSRNFSNRAHCPVRFDGYLCWPRTPAGTILSQYCPDFVEGFSRKFLAHKTCLANGTWYHHPVSGQEWSNYTNCVDYEDLEFRSFVNDLFVKGYTISLVALVLSLMIFLGFKSLRCTRIRIHVHLFASLALTCVSWLLWYNLVVPKTDTVRSNPFWCIILHLMVHYFMLVNYFWMFCEGLHLHLVLVVVFVKDITVMRWFILLSWISPFIFLTGYGVSRYLSSEENTHCWMNDSLLLWILSVPVSFSLIASFVFLVNVLRVIVRKLHPQSAQPAPLAIRKAVRATIILVPLFGLQHFLIPYRPETGTPLERFYQMLSVILVSLQGFVVSFLFCFANHDVIFAVRALLHRMLPKLISPPPPSSHTGQLATTTPSRELGL